LKIVSICRRGRQICKYFILTILSLLTYRKVAMHICEICHYSSKKQCDYDKHILTNKHKNAVSKASGEPTTIYKCTCGREYKHRQSLYNHHMKCDIHKKWNPDSYREPLGKPEEDGIKMESTLSELIKQNKELKTAIIEQNAMILEYMKTNTGITNNTTTTHNQQFNLNFYLNETCKDALNIDDFINSIQLQIDDLHTTGKLGYTEGISRIFIRALKSIDKEKRPIHCTDMKRETIYVKDQNAWEKEDDEKNKMRRAVHQIARMNFGQIPAWKESNPGYDVMDTAKNNEYLNITMSAMGGRNDDEEDKYMNKIIKNVLKEVTVDKELMPSYKHIYETK